MEQKLVKIITQYFSNDVEKAAASVGYKKSKWYEFLRGTKIPKRSLFAIEHKAEKCIEEKPELADLLK